MAIFRPPEPSRRCYGRRARVLSALCAAAGALGLALAAAPAQATTQTFSFTGAEQTFTVPAGVYRLHVVAIGGSGGAGEFAGGKAAQVSADLAVSAGQTLYVEVGGKGHNGGLGGGLGGFNGGADGGNIGAGGGGGAADIRTSPRASGLFPEDRLIVAAGGGGSGANGETGIGGVGGNAGHEGSPSETGSSGGGAGTETEGGEGGIGVCVNGENGGLGLGGKGAVPGEVVGGGGGGGGAGYYGGGGGGAGCTSGGGGGGGGSSLVPAGGSLELASLATEPELRISYNPPPSISIAFPANGATYTRGQAVSAVYSCNAGEGTSLKTCSGPVANGALFDTSVLGPHTFTVSAEDADGGRATQSVAYTVECPPPGGSSCIEPPPSPKLPDTVLGSHPKKTIKTDKKKVKVKFTFSSQTAGATFKCKLDKGLFSRCTSPKSYKVKPGRHTFSVEAASAAGADPTPATFSFKVKKDH